MGLGPFLLAGQNEERRVKIEFILGISGAWSIFFFDGKKFSYPSLPGRPGEPQKGHPTPIGGRSPALIHWDSSHIQGQLSMAPDPPRVGTGSQINLAKNS